MSKASYWQAGDTLDFINNTDEPIEANTIITLGKRLGIAGTTVSPGETGTLIMDGVFEMPKTSTDKISMGDDVYFDGAGITLAKGADTDANTNTNTPAGYAARGADASDKTVLVKLLG